MARITIEDCLNKVNNRFSLIHIAAKRVRQLRKGSEPTILAKNKDIVVALREIAAGHVGKSMRTGPASLPDGDPDNLTLSAPIDGAEGSASAEEEKEA